MGQDPVSGQLDATGEPFIARSASLYPTGFQGLRDLKLGFLDVYIGFFCPQGRLNGRLCLFSTTSVSDWQLLT